MIETEALIVFLVLALALDLILNAAKTAFINTRFEKLMTQSDGQSESRDRAARLLSRRSRLMFDLQTSHVLMRFMLAGLAVSLVLRGSPEDVSLWLLFGTLFAAAIATALLEQWIESRILPDPEVWSMRLAGFTRVFLIAFTPVLWIPRLATRLLPTQPKRFFRVTEDELNMILDAGHREGVLELDERKMINSIFLFRETTAKEIMIPRIDLLALNVDTPLVQAIDSMLESGYSRVPAYRNYIDQIVGVLYIKDLLGLYRAGRDQEQLIDHIRPAYFVPETKKVGELLADMQSQRNHIAIVVDEYGGVAGIATLEDIVEEIVGEIQDEYDQAEEQLYQKVSEDEYIFQAKIDINEFNEIIGADLSKETADTLGGMLYAWFGRVPRTGETFQSDEIIFTVEQVTGRRIRKVRALRLAQENQAASGSLQDPAWY